MRYSIKDLERLSGIKAHTIRIWEKRYNLLEPNRTDTNFRYYDDDHVKKLMNVVGLMRAGMKISKVSVLSSDKMKEELTAVLSDPQGSEDRFELYVNEMLSSGLSFDEVVFDRTFSAAIVRYGMFTTVQNIVYPLLKKIGILWGIDELNPAQEHFMSNIIKQKIFSAIDGLAVPQKERVDYVLFLPDWEDHEIGLLFISYLLKAEGYSHIYLGQRVPFQNLKETVEFTNPTGIITFFITTPTTEHLQKYLSKLEQSFPETDIVTCGADWLLNELDYQSAKKLDSLDAFLEFVKQ